MGVFKVGFGQDSHAFEDPPSSKPLRLAGVVIPNAPPLRGNSDADVVYHALGRAIDSITGVRVIGPVSDRLCQSGITDSRVYVQTSLQNLSPRTRITHIAVAIEARVPRLEPWLDAMRSNIAELLGLAVDAVGITVSSGDALTPFGQGRGIQAWAVVTVEVL